MLRLVPNYTIMGHVLAEKKVSLCPSSQVDNDERGVLLFFASTSSGRAGPEGGRLRKGLRQDGSVASEQAPWSTGKRGHAGGTFDADVPPTDASVQQARVRRGFLSAMESQARQKKA